MLVLSRKVGERIMIGDNIAVVINRIAGNRVTVGIEAPDDVSIIRGELEFVVRAFEDDQPASAPSATGGETMRCGPRRAPGEFHAPLMAYRAAH